MHSLLQSLRLSSPPSTHTRDPSSGSPRRDSNSDDYELLLPQQAYANGHRRRRKSTKTRVRSCLHHITLRKMMFGLCMIPLLMFCGLLWGGVPYSFKEVRQYERNLPQHLHMNASLLEDDG